MQRQTFATVENTAALSASILQARRGFAAYCRYQVVGISDYCHRLWLLLDVLDFDLLLLLLLLLSRLLSSGGCLGCLLSLCLLLSLK